MPHFSQDNLRFHYFDTATQEQPLVCLHGLGGNLQQPIDLFKNTPNHRLISLDFRGHGETACANETEQFGMSCYAEDVKALLDFLDLEKFILGGISLGAAVSLTFALRYPERVQALVLVRPAWLNVPRPGHLWVFEEIAELIGKSGTIKGLSIWKESTSYQKLKLISKGCADSLNGQFTRSQAGETWRLLKSLVNDAPFENVEALQQLTMPALVIGNSADPLHPLELAQELSDMLSNAVFKEVASRYAMPEQFQEEVEHEVKAFLKTL